MKDMAYIQVGRRVGKLVHHCCCPKAGGVTRLTLRGWAVGSATEYAPANLSPVCHQRPCSVGRAHFPLVQFSHRLFYVYACKEVRCYGIHVKIGVIPDLKITWRCRKHQQV